MDNRSGLINRWSSQLPWVEYANNTLVNASTGLSPFMASLGYQPPLFPELEDEIAVPQRSAPGFLGIAFWMPLLFRTSTGIIRPLFASAERRL